MSTITPSINTQTLWLLLGILTLWTPLLHAHDPGISRGTLSYDNQGAVLEISFAAKDLEPLTEIDFNFDGEISETEFATAKQVLTHMFNDLVELRHRELALPNVLQNLELDADGGILARWSFPHTTRDEHTLSLPLLEKLAKGHRQYLLVKAGNDNTAAQHLLSARSHTVTINGTGPGANNQLLQYVQEGIWHIWIGLDHLLFLITLLLPAVIKREHDSPGVAENFGEATREILKTVTAFTCAHSLTLGLTFLDVIAVPGEIIEPLIAFSIVLVAINNLSPVLPNARWPIALVFGLVHGCGFAGALSAIGMSEAGLALNLLGFNLGVEIGQVIVLAFALPILFVLSRRPLYRFWILGGGSSIAALTALLWMFQRFPDIHVLHFS